MNLPIEEIEEIAKERMNKNKLATHKFSHSKRTADGAVWFVKLLGGSEKEQ